MATGEIATKEVTTEETPIVEAETELPEVFESVQEFVRLHHIRSIVFINVMYQILKLHIHLHTCFHTVEQT